MDLKEVPDQLPAAYRRPGKVIASYMQKGGTGKTETTRGLIRALASYGVPVCAIDCDPHAALTVGLGMEMVTARANMANLLTGRHKGPIRDLLVPRANFHVIPSSVDMPLLEQDLSSVRFREERLRQAIEPLLDEYVVVLDCPNNPGLINDNALVAVAEEKEKAIEGQRRGGLLLVLQLEATSTSSLELVLDQVDSVNEATRYDVGFIGWFGTMVNSRALGVGRHRKIMSELPIPYLGEMPIRQKIKDAWEFGKLLDEYDPRSDALARYRYLAWKTMEKIYA